MSREKQIEIKVVTYKEERLNYFTALYEKAKKKLDRLFEKHKDAPYLSDEFQKLSDAGRGAEFLGDVVKMLKQSEWISVEERLPEANTQVLAINSDGEFYVATYIEHKISPSAKGYMIWASSKWNGKPTHWMPIPEAPKGGN